MRSRHVGRASGSTTGAGPRRPPTGAIDDFLGSLGDELFEPRVHRELASLLAPGDTVFVSSSMPVRDLETFFPASATPVRFLCNRGANGIDGIVSSGLGAAAASAGRTFVVLGDVALYHDMNGLLAAKRLGVEATIVVVNNGGGAIFDFLPIADLADGYEELFATPTGLDLERVAALYELPFTARRPPTRSCAASPGRGPAWSRYRSTARATSSCTASSLRVAAAVGSSERVELSRPR